MKKKYFYKKDTYGKGTSIAYILYEEHTQKIQKLVLEDLSYESGNFENFVDFMNSEEWIDCSSKNSEVIIDGVFDLVYKDLEDGIAKKYIEVFGQYVDIHLTRYHMKDENLITNNHRNTYIQFINNQHKIKENLDLALLEHFKECYEDWNLEEYSTEEEIAETKKILKNPKIATDKLLSLSYIEIFDNNENIEESIIKFNYEFEWDPEHGVGVNLKNWEVEEIGGCSQV